MGAKQSGVHPKIADKTVLKSLGQCSFAQGGEIASVDVKDGKIVRIRPHHHDERYTKEELGQYKLEKDGSRLRDSSQGPPRSLPSGLQEAGLFPQPHQVPAQAGRLGPGRLPAPPAQAGATPRTGARASSCASAGTRRRPSSPTRSGASTRSTGRWRSALTATATERPRRSTASTA